MAGRNLFANEQQAPKQQPGRNLFADEQQQPAQPVEPQPARRSMSEIIGSKMQADFVPPAEGDIPPSPVPKKPEATMGEKVVGAGETALAMGTGMTAGTIGQIDSFVSQLVKEIIAGEYGTHEAANRIRERTLGGGGAVTYEPKTEAGQEITEGLVEIAEPMAALAPLQGEISALTTSLSRSAPLVKFPKFTHETKFRKSLADDLKRTSAQPELGNAVRTMAEKVKSDQIKPEQLPAIIKGMEDDVISRSGQSVFNRLSLIANDVKKGVPGAVDDLSQMGDEIGTVTRESKLAQYMLTGEGKAQKNRFFKEARTQGFDEGVLAAVEGSTTKDKSKFVQMTSVMEKGLKDKRFAIDNRPSDVAGRSLFDLIKFVKDQNKQAGAQLDEVAKGLKGKNVNISQAVDDFYSSLDEMGIYLDDELKPVFIGSDIEGKNLKPLQNAVSDMVSRLRSIDKGDNTSAHAVHMVKKYIDEGVNFGDSGTGLSGSTERILKGLRHNLDEVLDNAFDEYNKANTVYAETRNAIDDVQNSIGKKIDLNKDYASRALGLKLRGVMSNANYGFALRDSIKKLENIGSKYGLKIEEDVISQALFADELDRVFGPVARTSLAGETSKAAQAAEMALGQKTLTGTALEAGKAGLEKIRGVNQENAIKAIRGFLEEFDTASGQR